METDSSCNCFLLLVDAFLRDRGSNIALEGASDVMSEVLSRTLNLNSAGVSHFFQNLRNMLLNAIVIRMSLFATCLGVLEIEFPEPERFLEVAGEQNDHGPLHDVLCCDFLITANLLILADRKRLHFDFHVFN